MNRLIEVGSAIYIWIADGRLEVLIQGSWLAELKVVRSGRTAETAGDECRTHRHENVCRDLTECSHRVRRGNSKQREKVKDQSDLTFCQVKERVQCAVPQPLHRNEPHIRCNLGVRTDATDTIGKVAGRMDR